MAEKSSSKIGSFIKGSTILVLSNMCLKAINFFLLPLYTDNLTTEMLGVSDSITNLTGILLPLLTMGLDSAFSAFYFDKEDPDRSKKVFHTLTRFFFMIGFIPILMIAASPLISQILFHQTDYFYIVSFALVSVAFNLWYLPYSLELRLKNKMFLFGLSNLISSLSMILLNVLFVSVLHLGAMSLILSMAIVHCEMLLILLFMVKQKPQKEFYQKSLMKPMLKFAIPLMPMSIMMWILSLSDQYVILSHHGEDAVGIYGIGLRFASLLNVVISAVSVAYTTFAFSSKDDSNAKKMYYYVFNIISVVLLGVSFTVSLFGKEIVGLMTEHSYHEAYQTLRDLMFAQSLYAMTTIIGYGIYFAKKSIYSLISVSTGAIVNLGLNLILVPKYGIIAAALTTLIGYALHYFITMYFSKKVFPCQYGELKVTLVLICLYAVSYFTSELSLMYKIPIWCACAGVSLFLFRKVISDVVKFAKEKMKSKKKKPEEEEAVAVEGEA